jgi:hypothetical protein
VTPSDAAMCVRAGLERRGDNHESNRRLTSALEFRETATSLIIDEAQGLMA